MDYTINQTINQTIHQITVYEICIKGHLGKQWAEWFAPLVIHNQADGKVALIGPVRDQAELHGVLTKLRNLNLPLLALYQVEGEDSRTVKQ